MSETVDRVKEFGEVFTPPEIVNDMMDMVDEGIYSNLEKPYHHYMWLEPACGDGNFLVEIIRRKLKSLPEDHKPEDVLMCYATTYGIDILADNVERARARMKDIYKEVMPDGDESVLPAIEYICNMNVIWGNTLTAVTFPSNGDLLVSEWDIQPDGKVSHQEFRFTDLTNEQSKDIPVRSYEENGYKHYSQLGTKQQRAAGGGRRRRF